MIHNELLQPVLCQRTRGQIHSSTVHSLYGGANIIQLHLSHFYCIENIKSATFCGFSIETGIVNSVV